MVTSVHVHACDGIYQEATKTHAMAVRTYEYCLVQHSAGTYSKCIEWKENEVQYVCEKYCTVQYCREEGRSMLGPFIRKKVPKRNKNVASKLQLYGVKIKREKKGRYFN